MATCSSDEVVRIWDVQTQKVIGTLHGHDGMVHVLAMMRGNRLVSGSIKIYS
jgi:WD40 repeat protein